ncbi:SDR family oxidoreductase [Taibaiella chishuiensis]|uniref:Putative oxidoreductase n=1 Tax=Taibaiella chishuiensis TaxID=1434707 RepID=A0A2P8D5F8_9BACT|nr:SDR family NAD(P)-dependent oxidoreductase [Taibaiella chishuiensis]PSK92432.1 putative oxidoreductase [Taibaiella chishuiensis]
MNSSKNTVLITGGSAGIGFALAQALIAQGNQVIITGRNKERLEQAAARLQHVTAIQSNSADPQAAQALATRLQQEFPQLNMVINNAGHAYAYDLAGGQDAAGKAEAEMLTNYIAVIRLNELLLPLLLQQEQAAIVNVSSITAFVPGNRVSTYSASKAALHSYSQSLRFSLAGTPVKVFELMPPLVNTDFSQEIGGANGIQPSVVADDLLQALQEDRFEIHTGATAHIYELLRTAPDAAFDAMNTRA